MKLLKIFLLGLFTLTLITSCSDDDPTTEPDPTEMEEEMEEEMENEGNGVSGEIWNGGTLTFTKEDGADPALEANQDRITDNVWITRGNSGGQIYNAKSEESANKANSPTDTEWALGTTADDLASMTFMNFRDIGKPKNLVGMDMVLHLITDDVYIDIKIDSWSAGNENAGGFSYTRSTK